MLGVEVPGTFGVTVETDQSRRLLVVFDREFGDRIQDHAGQPAWVVHSERNTSVVEAAWATGLQDVTLFTPSEPQTEQEFVSQLDMIDLHHGPYSTKTPYTLIEVIGARLTGDAEEALRHLGFDSFQSTPEGFTATRSKAEAQRLRRDAD
jgi:hypothetical protein